MAGSSSIETDEMDTIMSQITTSDSEFDENVILVETMSVNGIEASFASTETNEMDEIMSQIDTETMEADNAMDEIDRAISQIDTEEFQQEMEDSNLSPELLGEYNEAMAGITDEMIHRMQHEDDVEPEIPEELLEEFHRAMDQIIPTKSGNRYQQAYSAFRTWQASYGTDSFNEKIVLSYFGISSKKYKPPTLWSMYSMLKKTLLCYHNVDLVKHCRLRAFLKMKADGYEPRKANVFRPEHLRKFFLETPNDVYLGMKVVLIFGLCGGSRGCELTHLTLSNVKDDGKEVVVKIPDTKTKVPKMYVVGEEFTKIIRQYLDKRPSSAKTDRLFLQWRKGKCVGQVMGKHSIAKIPKNVARFLDWPEPDSYTGHSYRRTTTTVAADAGFSITELKRLMGWKSDRVCEGHIQYSVPYKRSLTNRVCVVILPSTSVDHTNSLALPSFDSSTPAVIPSTIPIPAAVPSTIPVAVPSTIPAAVPSTISAVVPSTIPAAVPSTIPAAVLVTTPIPAVMPTHKALKPMSIAFESSSGLTLSDGQNQSPYQVLVDRKSKIRT